MDKSANQYINHIGQTIIKGDRVVIVTTGYSDVYIKEGVFEGVDGGGRVICTYDVHDTIGYANEDGKILYTVREYYRDYKIASTLNLKHIFKTVKRKTTLKRNRVYKIFV